MTRTRWTRKQKITRTLFALAVLTLLYGILIESHWLKTERLELHLATLPPALDGFRIVHLTDIHYPRGFGDAYFTSVVARTNALQPDLIVITGDFITRQAQDADGCARILQDLHARYGVYAVLGNHDYWTSSVYVERALEQRGIRVLRNEAMPIQRGNGRLWLAGLDDYWQQKADIGTALRGVPAHTEPVITLVHEPDYADIAARYPVALQLSGHSHGGLVWIPGVGAPLAPFRSREYPRGLYRVRDMLLYTNRGVGAIPIFNIPLRLNCRPEVALITLRAGNGPDTPAPRMKHP